MSTSAHKRAKKVQKIRLKAKAPPLTGPIPCMVVNCKRFTQRSLGKGLSEVYCKRHVEHLRRHGHTTRRSYTKPEWLPYMQAAKAWLRANHDSPYVHAALTRLDALLSSAGRSKDADHHRSAVPKEKARIVLARLHEAGKTPTQLLEIVLTIKATHAAIGPRGYPDWPFIQIAKMAKRLRGASGTHFKRFEAQGYRMPSKYPRAEGRYMVMLGKQIEERAAFAIDREAIGEVLALVRKR